MDLIRQLEHHPAVVGELTSRTASERLRRVPARNQFGRVRLGHLEHVEVGIELGADAPQGRERLVEQGKPRRQLHLHPVDQCERLADYLERVDLTERGALVPVEHLAQLDPKLLLLLLVEAHPQVVQPPRQCIDVLVHAVDQKPGEPIHVALGERADLAEVDQAKTAVGQHEQVRGMRIAVEHAVAKDHLEPGVGDQKRQPPTLFHRRIGELDLTELSALEPLERQHPLAGVRPVHLGDLDALVLGEVAAKHLGVATLDAIVEFAADRAGELVDDADGVHELQPLHPLSHPSRDLVEQHEVGFDLRGRGGTLHLDRDCRPLWSSARCT